MDPSNSVTPARVNRRSFLRLGAAGGAGLLAGQWPGLAAAAAKTDGWFEASIAQLTGMMASGQLTSRELTIAYLHQIQKLNPLLGAVVETNPNAVDIATHRDLERRAGRVRGPLHGIPILVKDNIATADNMQTTAGSLALLRSRVAEDSVVVGRLRAAGAVMLGKANLSEWANFRGYAPFNGWSARGGFTRDPYVLDYDPCGSSSGSAVAPAANLCAGAVGTETDGSIVCPSGNNHVVGLKPTVGLISQDGIIPIAHSQDTAGPMARTVTDAAILLGVLQSPFGPVVGYPVPGDYAVFLQRGALHGARIGVDQRYFTPDYGGEPEIIAVVQTALDAMVSLGATLVPTDTGDPFAYFDAELTVLLYELKVHMGQYLATLSHTGMRTLADLIAFNIAHCEREMKYFGQEWFEQSEATSGDLNDPVYVAARQLCVQMARAEGIDKALAADDLDAIVAPSYSYSSTPAAVAGYPNLALPVGLRADGKPAGLQMYSGFLAEPKVLALAYDLEQELGPRALPGYLSSVPPEPPDAGICAALPKGRPAEPVRRHFGTGKPMRAGCRLCL